MPKHTIIEVTPENIIDHPGAICFINPKHPQYHKKVEWYAKQYELGVRIKLLYLKGEKKPVGFIEYVPGEHCWRPVDADGWMFIHCLWTNGKKYQHQGLGGELLRAVEDDAVDTLGVVAMTSSKSFMTTSDIFLKHGYQIADESGTEQLVAKPFRDGSLPVFQDVSGRADTYRGLTMLWSRQCPWVARFVEEVQPVLTQQGLETEFIECETPEQARQAPSVYGVFNLMYGGKVYSDRYISTTRFTNILKKEMKII